MKRLTPIFLGGGVGGRSDSPSASLTHPPPQSIFTVGTTLPRNSLPSGPRSVAVGWITSPPAAVAQAWSGRLAPRVRTSTGGQGGGRAGPLQYCVRRILTVQISSAAILVPPEEGISIARGDQTLPRRSFPPTGHHITHHPTKPAGLIISSFPHLLILGCTPWNSKLFLRIENRVFLHLRSHNPEFTMPRLRVTTHRLAILV